MGPPRYLRVFKANRRQQMGHEELELFVVEPQHLLQDDAVGVVLCGCGLRHQVAAADGCKELVALRDTEYREPGTNRLLERD